VTSDALELIDGWPAEHVAVAVVTRADGRPRVINTRGDVDRRYALASVTKLLTATAVLVAIEEEAVALDQAAGPESSTVRHLLAHASGLGTEGGVVAPPGRRRIYSNAGFEQVARTVSEATEIPFVTYLDEGVLGPLGMQSTSLDGSPAHGATATVHDLTRLAGEFLTPSLLDPLTLEQATAVAFPGLDGILPGFGQQSPNDWGLGFEIRGTKSPHWTATANSPATVGHFGRTGTFLWVDPERGVALVCLTDLDFGPWAGQAWPALGDAVLHELRV
jgi:CubicO group peptidase (beta-lactamase class C family)